MSLSGRVYSWTIVSSRLVFLHAHFFVPLISWTVCKSGLFILFVRNSKSEIFKKQNVSRVKTPVLYIVVFHKSVSLSYHHNVTWKRWPRGILDLVWSNLGFLFPFFFIFILSQCAERSRKLRFCDLLQAISIDLRESAESLWSATRSTQSLAWPSGCPNEEVIGDSKKNKKGRIARII